MEDIDLAKLIEPFTYVLDKTDDPTHTNRCNKDLLELIIYARNYCEKHYLPEIRKYEGIVAELMKYVHHEIDESNRDYDKAILSQFNKATERYADFVPVALDRALGHHYYTARNKTGNEYYIMARCGEQIYKLSNVNRWKADYFAIFNAIMVSEKKDIAYVAGYLIMDKYKNCECSVDDYDDCAVPIEQKSDPITSDTVEQDVATVEQDVATVESDPITSESNTHQPDAATVKSDLPQHDNYKKLFEHKDASLFSPENKLAYLKQAHDTNIVVTIGCNILVFDVGRRYVCQQSRTDLSKFVIDNVEYVTIRGDDNNYAYPGFIYEGLYHRISGLFYKTMYDYITFGCNDLSMFDPNLVKLANIIKDKTNQIPEIKFVEGAKIEISDNLIKITDGINVILTYDSLNDSYIDKKSDCIRSETIIGNFNRKPHLFLKIGKRIYKITEINRFKAARYLYITGYFN